MLFMVRAPTYIEGKHLCPQATTSNPGTIDIPEGTPVSVHWEPLDEAALKAHMARVEEVALKQTAGLDPEKDKQRIAQILTDVRKRYKKSIVKPPAPKAKVKEIETNAEAAEASPGRVVGRASDRSPV